MKTKKQSAIIVIFLLLSITVITACNSPLGLGSQLNLNGPIVSIDYPPSRIPIDGLFYLAGTAKGNSGIESLSVKAHYFESNGEGASRSVEFKMQWRYTKKGWEQSINSGKNWSQAQAVNLTNGEIKKPEWNIVPS